MNSPWIEFSGFEFIISRPKTNITYSPIHLKIELNLAKDVLSRTRVGKCQVNSSVWLEEQPINLKLSDVIVDTLRVPEFPEAPRYVVQGKETRKYMFYTDMY